MTEEEMREAKVPWIKSREELNQYLDNLETEELDYGKCVYCMSMAATAAFNYMAGRVGASGFQASCADLDVLRRTRGIERFMIMKLEDALFPQYDLHGRLDEFLDDNKDYLKEEAQKKLDEKHDLTHPDVLAHWRKLANG